MVKSLTSLPRGTITAFGELIASLKSLQANLAFNQKDVESAFRVLVEKKGVEFGLSDDQVADWVETMSKRLRTMLRHVNQALAKSAQPNWLKSLPE